MKVLIIWKHTNFFLSPGTEVSWAVDFEILIKNKFNIHLPDSMWSAQGLRLLKGTSLIPLSFPRLEGRSNLTCAAGSQALSCTVTCSACLPTTLLLQERRRISNPNNFLLFFFFFFLKEWSFKTTHLSKEHSFQVFVKYIWTGLTVMNAMPPTVKMN